MVCGVGDKGWYGVWETKGGMGCGRQRVVCGVGDKRWYVVREIKGDMG